MLSNQSIFVTHSALLPIKTTPKKIYVHAISKKKMHVGRKVWHYQSFFFLSLLVCGDFVSFGKQANKHLIMGFFLLTSKDRKQDIYTLITFHIELDTFIHSSVILHGNGSKSIFIISICWANGSHFTHYTKRTPYSLIKRAKSRMACMTCPFFTGIFNIIFDRVTLVTVCRFIAGINL